MPDTQVRPYGCDKSEAESQPALNSSRGQGRGGAPKKRRRLHTGEIDEIGAVQEIVSLDIYLRAPLLPAGSAQRQVADHIVIVAPANHHRPLVNHACRFRLAPSKSPTQPCAEVELARASCAVAGYSGRP